MTKADDQFSCLPAVYESLAAEQMFHCSVTARRLYLGGSVNVIPCVWSQPVFKRFFRRIVRSYNLNKNLLPPLHAQFGSRVTASNADGDAVNQTSVSLIPVLSF